MHSRKNPYQDKTVIITGGAQGIGACLVQAFIDHGAIVFFTDIDAKAGKLRQKHLNETSGSERAEFIKADLTDPSQIAAFIKKINLPSVDLLINNVGIFSKKNIIKRTIAEWDDILATNLRSAFVCSKLIAPLLAKAKGNIINIASTRAIMSEADTEPYSASKGGIVSLTHALSISLGDEGIRVNCISPGWIETSSWHLPPKKVALKKADHKQHPVGRVGKPEDIAEACLFLGSNETAGFITGQNIVIDGGMTKKMIYVE